MDINSSASDTTGYSAAYLVQGRELRLQGAIFDRLTTGVGEQATMLEGKEQRAKEKRNRRKEAVEKLQRITMQPDTSEHHMMPEIPRMSYSSDWNETGPSHTLTPKSISDIYLFIIYLIDTKVY